MLPPKTNYLSIELIEYLRHILNWFIKSGYEYLT